MNPFVGNIQVTLTGQGNSLSRTETHEGVGSQIQISQSIVQFRSPNYNIRNVSNRTSSPYSNTVTATVNITDAYGNTGPTKTTTTEFRDRRMAFYTGSGFSQGQVVKITVPYTLSSRTVQLLGTRQTGFGYNSSVTQYSSGNNWLTIDSSDVSGTINNTSYGFQVAANSGLARFAIITPTTPTGNSTDVAIGHTLRVDQEEFCVDPETSILTPTGATAAKDIKVGDVVRTKMEYEVDKWVQDRVIRVVRITMSEKIKLTFTDGSNLTASRHHRIWNDGIGDWMIFENFKVGDKASGKEVEKIEYCILNQLLDL